MSEFDQSTHIQHLLNRLGAGEEGVGDELIAYAFERLRRLARRELRRRPDVHALEQTDDLLQQAAILLYRAVAEVKPGSVRHFFALASRHMRRALIDLARHHLGPKGQMVRPAIGGSGSVVSESRHRRPQEPADDTAEPASLAEWTEFHERVQRLPDDEREVFELLWYQDLTQPEAASILGRSERWVRQRWTAARLLLAEAFRDEQPSG